MGNNGINTLTGTAFADTSIDGRGGNDSLIGGSGADHFRFTTNPNSSSNRDLIIDFAQGDDKLSFSKTTYPGFSSTASSITDAQFRTGAGFTTADTTTRRFIYNTTTGILYFDRDGSSTGYNPIQVAVFGATLSATVHPGLAYTDFVLTA